MPQGSLAVVVEPLDFRNGHFFYRAGGVWADLTDGSLGYVAGDPDSSPPGLHVSVFPAGTSPLALKIV